MDKIIAYFLQMQNIHFFVVYWHVNIYELFNAKSILVEEQMWYCLILGEGGKEVHAFLKSINPKMNLIVQLEFGHTYYDVGVQHVCQCAKKFTFVPMSKPEFLMLIFKVRRPLEN